MKITFKKDKKELSFYSEKIHISDNYIYLPEEIVNNNELYNLRQKLKEQKIDRGIKEPLSDHFYIMIEKNNKIFNCGLCYFARKDKIIFNYIRKINNQ